jgi:hypothetical protein
LGRFTSELERKNWNSPAMLPAKLSSCFMDSLEWFSENVRNEAGHWTNT